MNQRILHEIADQENFTLKEVKQLSGGSINSVFKLKTDLGDFVIKLNSVEKYADMFQKEALGLKLLNSAKVFKIPEVHGVGSLDKITYLLLEFIPTKPIDNPNSWRKFAEKLAQLHQNSAKTFGLKNDNYIGSLPQYNSSKTTNAGEFYIENRLKPQFEIALKKGKFSFGNLEKIYDHIKRLIPDEKPALIHGDLWNGNYMFGQTDEHILIDPAVCYSIREMDLAMMKLFGGFPNKVFEHYNMIYPLKEKWKERIDIWQLYYLLVHLNLFGQNYFPPITRTIQRFQ